MRTEQELRTAHPSIIRVLHGFRGSLRRLRPHVIDADVSGEVKALSAGNAALTLLLGNPAEGKRAHMETRARITGARQQAARIARARLREAAAWVAQMQDMVSDYRKD